MSAPHLQPASLRSRCRYRATRSRQQCADNKSERRRGFARPQQKPRSRSALSRWAIQHTHAAGCVVVDAPQRVIARHRAVRRPSGFALAWFSCQITRRHYRRASCWPPASCSRCRPWTTKVRTPGIVLPRAWLSVRAAPQIYATLPPAVLEERSPNLLANRRRLGWGSWFGSNGNGKGKGIGSTNSPSNAHPITGMECSNKRCERMRLHVAHDPPLHGALTDSGTTTDWFSDEHGGWKICPTGMFVTRVYCSGGYCDNKRLVCRSVRPGMRTVGGDSDDTQFNSRSRRLGDHGYCGGGRAVRGMWCYGSSCHTIKLRCQAIAGRWLSRGTGKPLPSQISAFTSYVRLCCSVRDRAVPGQHGTGNMQRSGPVGNRSTLHGY